MSYIRYTKALVSNGSRGGRDGNLTIQGSKIPSLEELQKMLPGSKITHGFQIIDHKGKVLASQGGFESELKARKGARELRRALLPGVRKDVEELAQAWDDAYSWGVNDARQTEDVGDPLYGPNRSNPYRQELEESK